MSAWSKYLRLWVLIGAYLLIVLGLVLVQGLLDMNGLWLYLNSLPFFLVLHTLAVVGIFIAMWRVFQPPEIRRAKLHGIPATAQVLESTRTKWRWRRFFAPWLREYRLQLQVMPPSGAPYAATSYAFFLSDNAPQVGAAIPVKIHPQRPHIVVVATPDQIEDKSWPKQS